MLGTIFLICAAYLVGALPVGVLLGRRMGFDPRLGGSGNIGMTNVTRVGGEAAGALTFAGDFLKGFLPVVCGRLLGYGADALILTGLAAFAGSLWSVFLAFRGGRGVSTSLGVWLALAPAPVAVSVTVFVAVLTLARIVSLASVSAALVLPVATAAFGMPVKYLLLALVMSATVIIRHRPNLKRLLRGEELAIGLLKKRSSPR